MDEWTQEKLETFLQSALILVGQGEYSAALSDIESLLPYLQSCADAEAIAADELEMTQR